MTSSAFPSLSVDSFFDPTTGTVSHVVFDRASGACALIDSVLDFDLASGQTSTTSAERLVRRVFELDAKVHWILETHVHADHLSAAPYLQARLGGRIGIGRGVSHAQAMFGRTFNVPPEAEPVVMHFNHFFDDGEPFAIGTLKVTALHTPGHTSACTTYLVADSHETVAFVGDTLFLPEQGTARCDFPGGDARTLYRSIRQVLGRLSPQSRLYTCHDYPTSPREPRCSATVAEQRAHNIHLRDGISENEFVRLREQRDATLPLPTLMMAAVRVNVRGGHLPEPEPEGQGVPYLACRSTRPDLADPGRRGAFAIDRASAIPSQPTLTPSLQRLVKHHAVVIVGAGAAGLAAAASLRRRRPGLDIAIVDPAETHCYQPGWTLVGAGVFELGQTCRPMASVMPDGVTWVRAAVTEFDPEARQLALEGGQTLGYEQLVVCPGLKLDWTGIQGLEETLGRNGVTSNYRLDLAPYTWELVRQWRGGEAVFTQPGMPIKCAGAPQKAMYLACDTWRRAGLLKDSRVRFFSANAALFGVAAYVPALMRYIESYGIGLHLGHVLTAVDGARKVVTVMHAGADGTVASFETGFDLLHVVPPQVAPDVVRSSLLADANGWVDVDPITLQHRRYAEVFALGDVANTPNAKTAAAVRQQAPVVAHNLLRNLGLVEGLAHYDGYGACPLTVEHGKIVLAEFLYGGKVAPTLPTWLLDGTQPTRLAWMLKAHVMPGLYWEAMLKGREWMAKPVVG